MKKFISLLLAILFSCNVVFADTSTCNWSQIKPLPDGGFEYSKTLHLCVGELVKENSIKDQQIADLNKAIQLKDLALTNSDARVALWQKSSDDELSRVTQIEGDQKRNDWLFFGLGALTVIGTGFALARLTR